MKLNPKDFWGIPEDKNIRKVSDMVLKFIYSNNIRNGIYQDEWNFEDMINLLEDLYDAVSNLMYSVGTQEAKKKIERFRDSYGGFVDFFSPYRAEKYGKCLEVIEREVGLLRKKDNHARKNWLITEGVEKELLRRGYDLNQIR